MKLRAALLMVAAVQSAVLVAMVGMKQWTLNTGTPVVLETQPIDPRSLFSGDYVRLNYAISRIRPGEVAGDDAFRRHDSVYLVLQPGAPYWTPVSVHRERPAAAPGQAVIRGEVQHAGDRFWDPAARREVQAGFIQVRYGIENYFVPEGEGRALERPRPGETVSLRVAVDRFGRAGIQAVLVNGEPRYREKLW